MSVLCALICNSLKDIEVEFVHHGISGAIEKDPKTLP